MASRGRPTDHNTETSPKAAATAGAEARGADSAPPTGGPARTSLPAARHRLRPEQVIVGPRLRELNPEKVKALMVSREETGELPPILCRLIGIDDDGLPIVRLVAGLHRLRACEALGVPVDCMVREMTDAEERLVEIDENLLGPDLNPLDRAVFVEARLRAWAERFPERVAPDQQPKRGRPKNSVKFTEFPTMGFADETAAEIGLSKSTVEKALQVARGLTAETRAAIANTWIARNEGVLRQLTAVADAEEQAAVVKQLVAGRTKSVAEARAYAAGREPIKPSAPSDEVLRAFEKLWKGAPATVRDQMLDFLAGQSLPAGWRVERD
jgi:hypothetical protein